MGAGSKCQSMSSIAFNLQDSERMLPNIPVIITTGMVILGSPLRLNAISLAIAVVTDLGVSEAIRTLFNLSNLDNTPRTRAWLTTAPVMPSARGLIFFLIVALYLYKGMAKATVAGGLVGW